MDEIDADSAHFDDEDEGVDLDKIGCDVLENEGDVWGGHLNKEKGHSSQPKPSSKSKSSNGSIFKKKQSHSSIFSKLLASDVDSYVAPVKSFSRISKPSTPSGKGPAKNQSRCRSGDISPESDIGTKPKFKSSFASMKKPSSVFSSPKTSVFMRRVGDTSFSASQHEVDSPDSDFGKLKSPETQKQRSGSWEAFAGDEEPSAPFADEGETTNLSPSSSFAATKSVDFSALGSSLLRVGNPERKPKKPVRKLVTKSKGVVPTRSDDGGLDDEPFSSVMSSPPKRDAECEAEDIAREKPIERTKRDQGSEVEGGSTISASNLASAWKSKVDEGVDARASTTTAREPVKRRRVADNDDVGDAAESKAKRPRTGGASAVSQNYIRVNLKKKKFVRGAKTLTGPKYKRQQWKERMKARGQGGTDKCYKCGEVGHWASKCTGRRGARPSGIDSEVIELKENMEKAEAQEEEEFPTMEDAAAMAQGVSYESKKKKKKPPVTSIYPEKKGKKTKSKSKDIEDNNNEEKGEFDFPDDDDDAMLLAAEEMANAAAVPVSENPEDTKVGPVFELDEDGKVPKPPKAVMNALKTFGHTSFRPGQEEAVMRILCGQSTLVILSTGAGKSLCYKLPAFLYGTRKRAFALVISPLVSLMEDQVADLPPGVKGACLHTNMTPAQRKKTAELVYDNQVHFLLMSPESLVGGGNSSGIINFSRLPPVAFACIDEAHCLSEWSHHFRPSYLRVCKVLREQLNVKCMLGLTATATMTTAVSVAHHLHITDFESAFIRGVPVPPNLVLSVSKDERRQDALIELLQGDRFKDLNSIIIYCTRRQETEQIATRIRVCLGDKSKPKPKGKAKKYTKQASDEPLDWDAEPYHAGLSAAARKRVQNLFMSGRLKVVVATVAFGMGLDKSDVRSVIHYNLPKTFESYVQEIGRAGRDGMPAHCHLFLDEQDLSELKKHTYGNTVDRYVLKKLIRVIFPPCKCREIQQQCGADGPDESGERVCHGHQRAVSIQSTTMSLDVREEGIGTLLCYLELHPKGWIENQRPTYSTCTIRCYGGQTQLRELAKTCPPVAAAVAWSVKSGVKPTTEITFPVVEIADMMGWDGGPVKRELYSAQWMNTPSGPRKTGIMVEFSDLAFHFRSPGDLTDQELDDVTDFLHERVQMQERTEIHQLKRLFQTLTEASFRDYSRCCDTSNQERSDWLRQKLLDYFDEAPTHDPSKITILSFAREIDAETADAAKTDMSSRDNYQLVSDIHAFINTYASEHTLTGRAIARIFQGIGSPCFPIEVWGKVRRFWRSHLATDFNHIRMTATRELMKFR